jgi:hypothetical protein
LSAALPHPHLTRVYRLEATLAPPLDLGEVAEGRRRIVPLLGGSFTGRELNGTLLSGASADWQIVLSDGTALGDIRYTGSSPERLDGRRSCCFGWEACAKEGGPAAAARPRRAMRGAAWAPKALIVDALGARHQRGGSPSPSPERLVAVLAAVVVDDVPEALGVDVPVAGEDDR